MLKTCRLNRLSPQADAQALKKALTAHDYLPVETDTPVDLDITQKGGHLLLQHHECEIVKTTAKDMLSRTKEILNQFSIFVAGGVTPF